jgi:hypothetical protein
MPKCWFNCQVGREGGRKGREGGREGGESFSHLSIVASAAIHLYP